jgi:biopolymer transport protein ExbB
MIGTILLQQITVGKTAADSIASAAQTAGNAIPSVPDAPKEKVLSSMELVMQGGWVLIPIALLLMLTIYVIIERVMVISKASRDDRRFMDTIKDYVSNGNMDAARALCRSSYTPHARVIEKGIARIGKPIKDIESAMEGEARLEIGKLERRMGILNIVGRIAPMLGFIGTIMGVIRIFYDISLSNTISIDTIAGGLYQKMITSAAGLMVGIVAFAAYHWLNIIIDKIISRIETSSVKFLDLLHEPTR